MTDQQIIDAVTEQVLASLATNGTSVNSLDSSDDVDIADGYYLLCFTGNSLKRLASNKVKAVNTLAAAANTVAARAESKADDAVSVNTTQDETLTSHTSTLNTHTGTINSLLSLTSQLQNTLTNVQNNGTIWALYEVMGATGTISHGTRVAWTLNGLTNITDAEMETIFMITHDFRNTNLKNKYKNQLFRTNLYPYNGSTLNTARSEFLVDCYSAFRECRITEYIKLCNYNSSYPTLGLIISDGRYMFYGCTSLVTIEGVLNVSNATYVAYMFTNCPNLANVKIAGLNSNIEVQSTALTLQSVFFMVQYSAATSPITITLAEVVLDNVNDDIEYNQDEVGIGRALQEHPNVHLAII